MTDEQHPQFTSSPDQWAKLKPLARQMRHEPTRAEEMLWQRIRNRRIGGAKFRRQHAVEGFVVDFACIERRLIVEVDGDIHNLPDQQVYDQQRQTHLESHGFRVLRFANGDVLQSIEAVAEVIGETLAQ
ncbi:MAG: endonuclease domain-containing protein [Anaerolineae bacterium]|nr:endonuclease domain-containing protein [Anaerolineae bacterium]